MYPKPWVQHPSFAYQKWPVSNPGMHGFERFMSTESSSPTSTLNCGCNPDWKLEGQGCVVGGGVWTHNVSFACMNYWSPTDVNQSGPVTVDPKCRDPVTATPECVANLTVKQTGDDSSFIVDTFEHFLQLEGYPSIAKRNSLAAGEGGDNATPRPFLAVLWLHTVHEPHAALPEFYHNYTDALGDPARDYLGSITQMDVQVGRLRQLLRDLGALCFSSHCAI